MNLKDIVTRYVQSLRQNSRNLCLYELLVLLVAENRKQRKSLPAGVEGRERLRGSDASHPQEATWLISDEIARAVRVVLAVQ